jgi:4-amino-4-deoxy-L-arabinose transferase-like glycosyltransferase
MLVVGYVGLMLPSLTRFPALNNDEGREANLYWVASGAEPGAERINAYRISTTWGTGGLQGATSAVLFRLFGLGIFQARLTSLLWGGLLLLVVYWLGRHYWGRGVGLAAASLLAISDPFLLSTHTLRPDVQIITLVLSAVALVEYGFRTGRAWPPVLAGLLLGLSFDTHMNTLTLMPLVGVALLVRYGWSVWRQPLVWRVALGLALAGVYYLAVRIVPDPGGYLDAFRYWIGVDKRPPVARYGDSLLTQVQLELLRYADYFGLTPGGVEEPGELALVLAALSLGVWRAVRGSAADRILLLGLLAVFACFVVAVHMKSRYYMLLTYPIYALLMARGFQQLASRLKRPFAMKSALAALVVIAAIWPLKVEERAWDKFVRGARYREGQEYYALTAQLEQLVGPEAKIVAPPLYWIGLHNHRFTDIFVYERVRRQFDETPAQFLETLRPDVVIADAQIATEKTIERELYRALDERTRRELVVRHKNYGDVAIYRLEWP